MDWGYMCAMMIKLGFHGDIVNQIMLCVTSVQFFVNVNGEMIGLVVPHSDLFQRDSLYLYLFIRCLEGLFALTKDVGGREIFHRMKVCRGALIISNLLLVDDSFGFFRAQENETLFIKYILDEYVVASSQLINLQMLEVMFSNNVDPNMNNLVISILGVTKGLGRGKYLGFLTGIGRNNKISSRIRFGRRSTRREEDQICSPSYSHALHEYLPNSPIT